MKKMLQKKLMIVCFTFFYTLLVSVPAFAASFEGGVLRIDETGIMGWATSSEDSSSPVDITVRLYRYGTDTQVFASTVKANQTIDGRSQCFYSKVNWSDLDDDKFQIKVYMGAIEAKAEISGDYVYSNVSKNNTLTDAPASTTSASKSLTEGGPGVTEKAETPAVTATAVETPKKGSSYGIFKTTGYCNCSKCSGGHNLTYSGTVPKANHTISADLSVLPLGTKIMINDIVYTVEDIGSSVNGNKLDIYYDTHEAAWAHGVQSVEVFAVN